MEELQDAIEDAQYVNAINTQDDGPKPVLPWETPSSDELLVEWSKTKARSLGNLDSFLEQSAICVFLFSSFIKQHHDDYVRLNFCEDVLRFKKLRGRSRRKQAQAILEHYILVKPSPPPAAGATVTPAATTSTNPTTTAPKDATNNGNLVAESAAGAAAWAVGTTQLPPRTEIDECDLERIVNDRQSTHAYLKEDASFRIYCDYPKCSQSLIGIRDAILDDLIDDWREWEEKEKEEAAVAAAKSRQAHPPSHHGSNGRRASASSTASGDFTTTNTTTLSSSKPRSTRRSSGGSTGGGRSSSVEPPNTTEETTADGSASASTDATVPTANPTISGWNQPQPPPQQQQQPQVETLDPNTDATKPEESAEAKAVKDADTAASSSLSFQSSNHGQPPQSQPTSNSPPAPAAPTNTTTDTASMGSSSHTPRKAPPPALMGERSVSGLSVEEFGEATMSMRLLKHRFLQSQKEAVYDGLFDKAETVVMESLRRDYWHLFLESQEFLKAKQFMWYQDRPVVPEDFYIMRVLGRGGFGLVNGTYMSLVVLVCVSVVALFAVRLSSNVGWQEPSQATHTHMLTTASNWFSPVPFFVACKKGTSGKLYAMKVMNKRRIKMKKSETLAVNERSALAAVESNFVVNLKYSFHSKDDVYLILDLMTGGDLGFHLHQKGRFPKREVQYYAARIMLGLQALHDQGYVYRDLKPENCLMADDGRVKITDLGLATKITPTLHGAAGTRGYWAPEMLRRDKRGKRMPYGHTVDWFSFGCCVTEFICGANPFRSEAALNFGLSKGKQTKEKAIDCATLEMEPDFPKEYFEPDAKDLCMRLLEKDEHKRLGTGGCEEIMAHPYFRNVNWESIISDRKRPPYVPAKDVNAASQAEIGNFVEDKTYQETVLTEQDETYYRNWDWTNPRAYATEVIEFLIYERETGEPLLPVQQNAGCCCVVL